MIAKELACLAIVLLYVGVRSRREDHPATFLMRMLALSIASWIGEDTMIRFYGFYRYSPEWSLFIDRVPVLVSLIWPVVIHSARDLAGELCSKSPRRIPWVAGAVVFSDALLIEPVAVHAGLWSWEEGAWFHVPVVGILGWAYFAAAAVWVLEARRGASTWAVPLVVAHLGCLATWWGALRWLSIMPAEGLLAAAAWVVCTSLVFVAWRSHARVRIGTLILRAPGAGFFFTMLATTEPGLSLIVYALAFAPPYLSLLLTSVATLDRSHTHCPRADARLLRAGTGRE